MAKNLLPKKETTARPPIVVVMGHIDHGKTTLLDKIRETNAAGKTAHSASRPVAGRESGGITQHIGAYEVTAKTKDGSDEKITFIDTPGHEAFSQMRSRGALAADIAILVVAADDGVKPQTEEALNAIREAGIPFIVAVNKTDKAGADPDRVKKELSERQVYVEGWGGQIPVLNISAKNGTGIDELLEMILLVAELEPEKLAADFTSPASGVVIESHLDPKRGKAATLLILDGHMQQGDFVVAGSSFSPVRIFENFAGQPIKEAGPSEPARIVGFNEIPAVGMKFSVVGDKVEAEKLAHAAAAKPEMPGAIDTGAADRKVTVIPLVLKADVAGSLEAIENEINKIQREHLLVRILKKDTGPVGEDDVTLASSGKGGIVIGFRVKLEKSAEQIAERFGVTVKTFEIIYELFDWLREYIGERLPNEKEEQVIGRARILKIFSKKGTKQVVGGTVLKGQIKDKSQVRLYRRENMLALGKIIELQQSKMKTVAVDEGNEFGIMIDVPIEIAPRDEIEAIEEKITKLTL